ncbi:MAG: hypothetical protein HZA89_08490 [Verrucomicrobia bacterium]|nr:hypothetical protein [Verrucomicrobiota bacterium]
MFQAHWVLIVADFLFRIQSFCSLKRNLSVRNPPAIFEATVIASVALLVRRAKMNLTGVRPAVIHSSVNRNLNNLLLIRALPPGGAAVGL